MNVPYHLVTIVLVTLILYLTTFLATKINAITKLTHRRIWNSLLLLTFLVTAILGLLLALQVNYKVELPGLDTYMVFHVDFGIAMTIVSIIHLVWHWNYYIRIVKPALKPAETTIADPYEEKSVEPLSSKTIRLLLFYLGFQSIIVQTIYIREFLALFSGNELIIGIILALWMVFVAVGSYVSKKVPFHKRAFQLILVLLALLPLVTYVGMNLLRYKIFIPGSEINLFKTTVFITVFQFPFCVIAGLIFPQLVVPINSTKNEKRIGLSYGIETIGSVVGGLLLGFVLFHILNNFTILLIGFIAGSLLFIIQLGTGVKKLITAVGMLMVTVLLIILPVEKKIKAGLYINQEIIEIKNSVYGEVVKTRQFEQVNIYENQHLIFSSGINQEAEELVHFALIQHDNPTSVLVISSGLSQVFQELNLYPSIKDVDVVEMNNLLLDEQKQLLPDSFHFDFRLYTMDPLRYITTINKMYDVILIQTPEPSTLNYNRYYTLRFYELAAKRLNHHGLISTTLAPGMNYLNPELINFIGLIYYTVNQVFNEVMIFPGYQVHLLASNDGINDDLTQLLEEKGIEGDFVNPYYLDVFSMNVQKDQILAEISNIKETNTQNNPKAFVYFIQHWFSKLGNTNKIIPIALAVLLLLIALFIRNAFIASIFFSGFTISSVEFMVILLFQMTLGSVYHYISVIVAVFMIGMALGAFRGSKPLVYPLQITMAVLLVLISIPMKFFNAYGLWQILPLVVMGMLISFICGLIFVSAANSLKHSIITNAGIAYSFDLFGAALGAFIIPVLVIPFIGFFETIFSVAVLNLAMGTVMLIRKS